MTAIKASSEVKIILDFSNGKCSKNRIKQALRHCDVVSLESGKNSRNFIHYLNTIRVGMYDIILLLPFDSFLKWRRIRDYGDFEIAIYDNKTMKAIPIILSEDPRFKNQPWVSENFFGKLRIKHLVDIVAHCHRLNNLKAFL